MVTLTQEVGDTVLHIPLNDAYINHSPKWCLYQSFFHQGLELPWLTEPF